MKLLLREELASIIAESVSPAPLDIDFPVIDVSPRAQTMREILRISNAHGWQSAIVHFLQLRKQSHIADLTDPQLDDLLERMQGYVDAAEMGCSLADCLPAG